MTEISNNFRRGEFACHCGCGFDTVDIDLVVLLEQIRWHFNKTPILVHSGARCASHNSKVGGSKDSQHLIGKAADISMDSATSEQIVEFVNYLHPKSHGLGVYSSWAHVDVRKEPTRW